MPAPVRGIYDDYAYQRIILKPTDLTRARSQLSLSAIADAISDWRGIVFHRKNFQRLREYTLTDPHTTTIVDWIVEFHDPKFREKLKPDAIFFEVGESSREFYYHLHQREDYDVWEEDVLQGFAGVYICAPAEDRNSYLPMPVLRPFFADYKSFPEGQHSKRTLDIKQYIAERSILILYATPNGYYHAAEFPLSLLFPHDFVTLDVKMVHEGIGIASGNSIRVFMRECLSRVSKSHSILIHPKGRIEAENPLGISINVAGHVRKEIRSDWNNLSSENLAHLRAEFAETIKMDFHLAGNTQTEVSPLPNVKNRVDMTITRECVYHRKPADFLRHPDIHFIRPDIRNDLEIARIIKSPLTVGELK